MNPAPLHLRSWLPALLLGATLLAQAPSPRPVSGTVAAPAPDWRLPIHTQQADAVGGEYGWWAAGDDYKVSFHDGFAFYPYLGPDYPENLPLRWRTARITAGGQPLCDLRQPRHHHGDWRYEYRYDGVTEAYDVRADGVEQTFVLHARPGVTGDVVVEGRVETRLRPPAATITASHTALVFCDGDQRPLVSYGRAFAVDATGARVEVTTALAGDRIQLTVPAAWLAGAAFPVTIDPLTSRTVLSTIGRPDFTAIHREDESATNNVMMSYARQFSATDYDLYARLAPDDLTTSTQVYSDITTTWSTAWPDVTFVGGADRWLLTFFRHYATGETQVRVYFHDKGNVTLNSGATVNYAVGAEHHTFPVIGGSSNPSADPLALLVYRSDNVWGNTDRSVIWGVVVNAQTRTFGARFQISRPNLDAEGPDVNSQRGWFDDSWVVAYEGRNWNSTTDDYDVYAARITTAGLLVGDQFVGPDESPDKVRPVVEGWDGRYLVAMLRDPSAEFGGERWGREVFVERFDWPTAQATPTKYGWRLHAVTAGQTISHLRLGFDGISFSHWCLVFQAESTSAPRCHVRRLGFSGGTTEGAILDGGAAGRYHPAVTWNASDREFPIIYCSTEATQPVYAQRLTYPTDAINVAYGTSCANPAVSFTATPPYAGSEFHRMDLGGRPNGTPCALLLSLGGDSLPLDFMGMNGCRLNVSLAGGLFLVSLPTSVSGGVARHTLRLPDAPLFTGNLYGQWVWLQPGLNPLGLGASQGLRMQVR